MIRTFLSVFIAAVIVAVPSAPLFAQTSAPLSAQEDVQAQIIDLRAKVILLLSELVTHLRVEIARLSGDPVLIAQAQAELARFAPTELPVEEEEVKEEKTTSKPKPRSSGGGSSTPRNQEPRYTLMPYNEVADISVSSGDAEPKFTNVVINPLHVYVGDTQTFTVTVEASEPVVSVTSTTELDNETVELPLSQISTSGAGSTWQTSWQVYDTHVRTYYTTFTARTQSGDENDITLAWSDPCSGTSQGVNSTLSGNCTVSAVDGVDGGNLTIPNGVTLTLNSGAVWAWNPGTSITVDGAIAVNGTAELRKGYLFYSGTTNDNANVSSLVFDTNSTLASHIRAGTFFRFTAVGGAELSTSYGSNTVTIGGITNGTTISFSRANTTAASYSKNGGGAVSIPSDGTSTTINSGDTILVTLSTQAAFLEASSITATVGSLSSTFTVTTKAAGCGESC